MSSPISPLTDRIEQLGQMGNKVVNMIGHPVQAAHDFMFPPPQQQHEQAMQQMNQGINAHNNDAANASFVHPPAPHQGVLTQQARKPR